MVNPDLPDVPPPLRSIEQYLKIAASHDQRDNVISYWCRLYALQTGLKLSTKTLDDNNFLLKLMDWLETTKKELRGNEAISNDIAAQAHIENWTLKLFLYADKKDREGDFSRSTIQSFFTAGLLYDILTVFGELSEEAAQNRKYAKWKATYIHNCLKNGETPVPGPVEDNTEAEAEDGLDDQATPGERETSLDLDKTANVVGNDTFDTTTKNLPKKGSMGEGGSEIRDDYHPTTETEDYWDMLVRNRLDIGSNEQGTEINKMGWKRFKLRRCTNSCVKSSKSFKSVDHRSRNRMNWIVVYSFID
ncbi:vesicle trafficking 1 isoform X2 [Megalopta genalis]|uniref:vesicle trafficking 1 isoform X2 n=1 Tax=Megalopta genalis TaxID=115081 RepID=UPI003FD006EA